LIDGPRDPRRCDFGFAGSRARAARETTIMKTKSFSLIAAALALAACSSSGEHDDANSAAEGFHIHQFPACTDVAPNVVTDFEFHDAGTSVTAPAWSYSENHCLSTVVEANGVPGGGIAIAVAEPSESIGEGDVLDYAFYGFNVFTNAWDLLGSGTSRSAVIIGSLGPDIQVIKIAAAGRVSLGNIKYSRVRVAATLSTPDRAAQLPMEVTFANH
jgi:hypothetical protein